MLPKSKCFQINESLSCELHTTKPKTNKLQTIRTCDTLHATNPTAENCSPITHPYAIPYTSATTCNTHPTVLPSSPDPSVDSLHPHTTTNKLSPTVHAFHVKKLRSPRVTHASQPNSHQSYYAPTDSLPLPTSTFSFKTQTTISLISA